MPAELAHLTSAAKMPHVRSPSGESEDGMIKSKKKKKSLVDDAADPRLAIAPLSLMDGTWICGGPRLSAFLTVTLDSLFKSLRTIEMICNPDGSATSHVVARCTLADLARATNLRPEDAAFALDECGLLSMKKGEGDEAVIAVSREMVEAVAKERRVKRMCMDLAHVIL
jgi:histone acetyltransferase MYST1